jgi:outer membrane protein TolC
LEISDAYLSMKEAEKRISTNKIAVEEASVNFAIAQRAYSAGVGTNLDVMDAELALNQAKTNYTNSLFDYNISKARLDKAIGSE